ncbi:MAG: hypothetical protein HRT59_25880, partial [Crocosphaera sp.]|nr:hypothetical protein [Crocosphaera sp.]
ADLFCDREYGCNLLKNRVLLLFSKPQVDFQWGKMYDERPYFQSPGQPPHPDDEYTHESVEEKLKSLLTKL